jgi:hypothetical protein
VATDGLGLRVVKVLLVERSNTVGALFRVLSRVVGRRRRHGAQAHGQAVVGFGRVIDSETKVLGTGGIAGLRGDDSWGWRCDLEAVAVALC